mgnify:CR=1 FL=1
MQNKFRFEDVAAILKHKTLEKQCNKDGISPRKPSLLDHFPDYMTVLNEYSFADTVDIFLLLYLLTKIGNPAIECSRHHVCAKIKLNPFPVLSSDA